jgi:hypothetical protein
MSSGANRHHSPVEACQRLHVGQPVSRHSVLKAPRSALKVQSEARAECFFYLAQPEARAERLLQLVQTETTVECSLEKPQTETTVKCSLEKPQTETTVERSLE